MAETFNIQHSTFNVQPVFIAGPTAVGKSEIALALAEQLGGEIISVDSMQVYRGLDIGTAKPSPADRARVPHHLIDICDLTRILRRRAIHPARAKGGCRNPVARSRAGFLRRHGALFQGVFERTRRSAVRESRTSRRTGSSFHSRTLLARIARARPGGLRKN